MKSHTCVGSHKGYRYVGREGGGGEATGILKVDRPTSDGGWRRRVENCFLGYTRISWVLAGTGPLIWPELGGLCQPEPTESEGSQNHHLNHPQISQPSSRGAESPPE